VVQGGDVPIDLNEKEKTMELEIVKRRAKSGVGALDLFHSRLETA